MTKNYVLKPIYNDENECVHDTLSLTMGQVIHKSCSDKGDAYMVTDNDKLP